MFAKTSIPMEVISPDPGSYHILVEGRLGEEVFNFIIDTGASRSSFDETIFGHHVQIVDPGENPLKTTGLMPEKIESRLGILRGICFGEMHIEEMDVVLFDMNPFIRMYREMTGKVIHGLLGSDFLNRFGAHIDYNNRQLNLNF